MSKKYVVFVVILALVVLSGGCSGSSSSLIAPNTEDILGDNPVDDPENNPYGVVLEDVLLSGAELTLALEWNSTPYELKFRNLGNGVIGDFELLNSQSDLPFNVKMGYGTTGISASFTDKEYNDISFFFVVDVQKNTYYEEFSNVLQCIWSRYDGINGFKVNGVEFIYSLEYEELDYGEFGQEPTVRYTLEDVFEEDGVFSINFTMDDMSYNYTWRKVRDSLDYSSIDDYNKNELSVAEMIICGEGFDTIFVNENNSKWVIVAFNKENSSYRIKSNTENIQVNSFYVNGENQTERTTLVSSNSSILGDTLLKGSTVNLKTVLNGEAVEFGFVNKANGDNIEFICLQNSSSTDVSLRRVGRNLSAIFNIEEVVFDIIFSLVDDTYTVISSSSDYRFEGLILDGADVTGRLTDDPLETK